MGAIPLAVAPAASNWTGGKGPDDDCVAAIETATMTTFDTFLDRAESKLMSDDVGGDSITAEVLSGGTMRVHTDGPEWSEKANSVLNNLAQEMSDDEESVRFETDFYDKSESHEMFEVAHRD